MLICEILLFGMAIIDEKVVHINRGAQILKIIQIFLMV